MWWGGTITHQKDSRRSRKGYIEYENSDIKAILKKYREKYWQRIYDKTPAFHVDGFTEDILCITKRNRFLLKIGVEYFNAFLPLNPLNVFIHRKTEDVAQSITDRFGGSYSKALDIVNWRFEQMDMLKEKYGGVSVDTDHIIEGDYSGIRNAIEYCGLKWDQDAISRSVV